MSNKEVENRKKEIYNSCPYLDTPPNYWKDAYGRLYDIKNEYQFEDSYLLNAYGTLKREYKNHNFHLDDYNTVFEDVKADFETKMKELYEEMKRRKIEHRFKG